MTNKIDKIQMPNGQVLELNGGGSTWGLITGNIAAQTDLQTALNNKQDKGNYALKSEIPTKTSQLTNDSDYITSSYHDSTKQDKLTAGDNIAIIDNVISAKGGSGLEICDIGMALYVDETKGLRRYLNGQIVDINTNTQAFLNRLLEIQTTNPDYFSTEDNWQAEALLNIDGCVYKFVLNYSGETVVSVRLPKYPDYVEISAGGTLPVVGNGMTLGLYDGTNNVAMYLNNSVGFTDSSGVGLPAGSTSGTTTAKVGCTYGVTLDASKSGIEATLKQTKLKMRYFIQIATGSETENNIINEIELNNPYSLFECKYADHELFNLSWLVSNGSYNGSNAVHPSAYQALLVENNAEIAIGSTVTLPNGVKYTKQGLSVKLSTETYTDYDFVVNPADETFRPPIKPRSLNNTRYLIEADKQNGISYRIYSDGFCEQWGHANGSGAIVTLLKPYGDTGYHITLGGGNSAGWGNTPHSFTFYNMTSNSFQIKMEENSTLSPGMNCNWLTLGYLAEGEYTPLADNILLYYYVGETVQNANLIDAGRIGEQVASLTTVIDTYINGTSGYRIWSDGYCEQWGASVNTRDVTFLKKFINTDWNFVGGVGHTATNYGYDTIKSKTVSGFTFFARIADLVQYWRTCGYLAEGEY